MPIQLRKHLGSYEILSAIGAGGMGEVYRARDSKLGRDVAIKVLPEEFAHDPERMARFQREAKFLASLNHSNIASIHGLEDSDGTRALVMELVEGPTLADRIRSGAIPLDEALPIARQICDALEYAHERGIVHRDLKPSNIKVTADDTVKILDFGLARAVKGDGSATDVANSPTLSQMATQAGILLGTAAYMSPEQAKGKLVDRRTDIWAFGCVLYEMLTGKMAFRGEAVTDVLAAIIKEEPDWSQLPAATPTRVRVLLQRCLQKDPKQRLRDIGDARISLDEVLSGAIDPLQASPSAGLANPRWLWPGVAAVLTVIAVAGWLAFLYLRPKAPTAQVQRFEIPFPEKLTLNGGVALSPDGRKLAFVGTGADGQTRLWVRSLETLEEHQLDGTEGAFVQGFWSPDSRFIAFEAQGKLKKIEASGGPALTLCNVASNIFGGAWNRDDKIIYGSSTGIMQVAASGGSPWPITAGGPSGSPSFLPDGRHFVYARILTQGPIPTLLDTYLGTVDAQPQKQPSKKLLAELSFVVFTPSSDPALGYLLFVRGATVIGGAGTLMAQPFDTRRFELIGEAVPIAEQVSNAAFSASATDVLGYLPGQQAVLPGQGLGEIRGELAWVDREGKALGTFGDPGFYRSLALSPDGKRVALERVDFQNSNIRNIWLYEFARDVTTRFTFDSGWDSNPVWSPDGSRIAFGSMRGGRFDLYEKNSNLGGEDELLLKSGEDKLPSSWSPDGRSLLYNNPLPPNYIWLLPLGGGGADRKPVPIEHSEFSQGFGRFSPDGRWIAYRSDESGRNEIYVRPFDASSATGTSPANGAPATGKWMVSKDGGISPLWRRDGKELFYLGLDGNAMAVEVDTSGAFRAGIPKALFKVPLGLQFWEVSPDGKRFLMPSPSAASAQPPFTVVLNWQAGLKK